MCVEIEFFVGINLKRWKTHKVSQMEDAAVPQGFFCASPALSSTALDIFYILSCTDLKYSHISLNSKSTVQTEMFV